MPIKTKGFIRLDGISKHKDHFQGQRLARLVGSLAYFRQARWKFFTFLAYRSVRKILLGKSRGGSNVEE
ncbi:uncharacterized protein G2W53_026216 [Senna tora]|uniref:Uncharacterized protein n=1 Tax=Senna tora TaxID=362788 RepID=A0A834WIL5_9FABA|nr:uncharacterized protein G2W53_026216 [Senna tora]